MLSLQVAIRQALRSRPAAISRARVEPEEVSLARSLARSPRPSALISRRVPSGSLDSLVHVHTSARTLAPPSPPLREPSAASTRSPTSRLDNEGMHPPLTARPRPPARRNASKGKFTALPTPSTPRRRRQSQLDADANTGDDDSLGGASGQRASLGLQQHGPMQLESRREAGASQGDREAGRLDEPDTPSPPPPSTPMRSGVRASTCTNAPPTGVPFPQEAGDPFDDSAITVAQQDDPARNAAPGLGIDEGDTTISIDALKGLSRDELERMLQEADRIIRDKEQGASSASIARRLPSRLTLTT